jgi:hypothetical protein
LGRAAVRPRQRITAAGPRPGARRQHHHDRFHGRSDLVGLVLGGTAHKVIHLADRPVLVIR